MQKKFYVCEIERYRNLCLDDPAIRPSRPSIINFPDYNAACDYAEKLANQRNAQYRVFRIEYAFDRSSRWTEPTKVLGEHCIYGVCGRKAFRNLVRRHCRPRDFLGIVEAMECAEQFTKCFETGCLILKTLTDYRGKTDWVEVDKPTYTTIIASSVSL